MVLGNVELMQECFEEHSRSRTESMKNEIETEEEGEKRVNMQRGTAGRKKDVPTASGLLSQRGRYSQRLKSNPIFVTNYCGNKIAYIARAVPGCIKQTLETRR